MKEFMTDMRTFAMAAIRYSLTFSFHNSLGRKTKGVLTFAMIL
jgi:hypothetical protein